MAGAYPGKTLIIIPAYNEEKSISFVIQEIKNVNPSIDILIVNDGSKDNTSIIAKTFDGTTVIDLPFNLGIGGAMQTGYLYALKNGYEFAVQLDADGQHDPRELDKILLPVQKGEADLLIGSRYISKTDYSAPISRRIGMVILSGVVFVLTKEVVKDTTSGFRAMNKKVIKLFAENYPSDYPEVETLVIIRKKGFKIKEVSVNMRKRVDGLSSITPIRSIYYMIKVILALIINASRNYKDRSYSDV